MTTKYLRSKDEVCKVVPYDKNDSEDDDCYGDYNGDYNSELNENIRHGDIIYVPNSYRAQNAYVLSEHEPVWQCINLKVSDKYPRFTHLHNNNNNINYALFIELP